MNVNNNKIIKKYRDFFLRKPIQKFLKANNVDKIYEFADYYSGFTSSEITSFLVMVTDWDFIKFLHVIPTDFVEDSATPEKLYLPNCTKIRYSAFKDCLDLKHIILGPNLEVIEDFAFKDCHSLESICFEGNKILYIGYWDFHTCPKLKEISFGGTAAEWEEIENLLQSPNGKNITVKCTDKTIII